MRMATIKIIFCISCVAYIILNTLKISAYDIDEVPTWATEEILDACDRYGRAYDVSPYLILAVIERESCGDPSAVNGSCKGLMQVSKRWHIDRMHRLDAMKIYDVEDNILIGTDYLAELIEQYDGDIAHALTQYHGEKNYNAEKPSKYVKGIMQRAEELRIVFEGE